MAIDPSKPFDLEYKVDESQDGMRLDKYIASVIPTISRTKIKTYNSQKRITVNGEIKPDSWKVKDGDMVVLKCRVPEGGENLGKNIPVEIIFEDDYLIAVNKQAGLVVHPVALHRHNTLMNALYWKYKDKLSEEQDITLVNRIDQYTSGVVLVCKDLESKRNLQEQFEARTVSKSYLAIVCGELENGSGEIDLPIGPKKNRTNRVMMGIRHDEEGKPSHTFYEVIERLPSFTVVRLTPKTGRQHQLRVHMAEIGHPLAADHLYGDDKGLKFLDNNGQEICELSRFALHAKDLTFIHPVTEKEMTIEAPLPDDMANTINALRENRDMVKFSLNKVEYMPEKDRTIETDKNLSEIYGDNEFDRL